MPSPLTFSSCPVNTDEAGHIDGVREEVEGARRRPPLRIRGLRPTPRAATAPARAARRDGESDPGLIAACAAKAAESRVVA
jgi:hypothetical protein